jgi:glyoxylase-like metal-dependent hydrolase (beta-lactamase superfamily II)
MSIQPGTYKIGDVTVTKVSELVLTGFTPAALFPDWDPKVLEDQRPWLSSGSLDATREHALMSVHTWLVRTPKHVILVDPGVGNGKPRPFTPMFDHLDIPFLARLKKAGVEPEAVDYVLMTHLHVDHVGWNTRLAGDRWVPTFPNAKYVFSRIEREYFTNPANHSDRNKTSFIIQRDSITPIIKAGLAEEITINGGEFIDGLAFHPTPGHSVDHASISLTSRGEWALFAGDTLHHPIQVHRPEWNSIFDAAPEQARASRRWVLKFAAEHKATVFTTHLPETSAGRVKPFNDGFNWSFDQAS